MDKSDARVRPVVLTLLLVGYHCQVVDSMFGVTPAHSGTLGSICLEILSSDSFWRGPSVSPPRSRKLGGYVAVKSVPHDLPSSVTAKRARKSETQRMDVMINPLPIVLALI